MPTSAVYYAYAQVVRMTVGARADRGLLQASAPSSSVTPANTSLPDLTATQAIAMLCARDVTSVEYVQALFDRYDSGGFECLNAFISLNRTKVKPCMYALGLLSLFAAEARLPDCPGCTCPLCLLWVPKH